MATLNQWKINLKAANPSLTKMVNGNSIDLTTAEYDKTIDEWAQASFDQESANYIIENGGESANYAQYRRDAANSTTTWADAIAAVKTKYAKPS
jgi:hypothetical protein